MERIIGIGLLVLLALVGYLVLRHSVPLSLPFKPISAQDFAGLIAWLFALALFVERAVEVVVMVLRDREADLLDKEVAAAKDRLHRAKEPKELDIANAELLVALQMRQTDYR